MMRALGALSSVLVLLLSSGVAHAGVDPRDNGLWAGYVARNDATPTKFFGSVSAEWTVPPAKCLHDKDLYGAWVGLGGGNNSFDWLIQIGTVTDCKARAADGTPLHHAFRESVRPGGGHGPPQDIDEIPVRTNDRIYAEVVFDNLSTYVVTIQNLTLNTPPFRWYYQPLDVKPNTAEAVVEAKARVLGEVALYPDFGSLTFRKVRVDGKPIYSSRPEAWQAFRNQNRANLQAEPGIILANPAGDNSFKVSFRHE